MRTQRFTQRCAAVLLATTLMLASNLVAEPLDQHGKKQSWKGVSGQLTVIDFAASWCLPCVKSLPRLDRLAADNPNVTFIVVSVDKKEAGRDFLVDELKLRLPVLWDGDYEISSFYEPEGMPTTVVLNQDGKEVHRHTGFSERQWGDLVDLVSTAPSSQAVP